MSFVENSQEIQDGTRRQIEEKGTVRWRSAVVKVAAYTMAWSIVAAGVESVRRRRFYRRENPGCAQCPTIRPPC